MIIRRILGIILLVVGVGAAVIILRDISFVPICDAIAGLCLSLVAMITGLLFFGMPYFEMSEEQERKEDGK